MLVYVHEIAANITCYCRNVIANGTHDANYCRVLFGPSLAEALDRTDSYAKATSLLGKRRSGKRLITLEAFRFYYILILVP